MLLNFEMSVSLVIPNFWYSSSKTKSSTENSKSVKLGNNISKKEESLIYNAQKGNCLISAGTRKIFATIKIPNKERKIIDENY